MDEKDIDKSIINDEQQQQELEVTRDLGIPDADVPTDRESISIQDSTKEEPITKRTVFKGMVWACVEKYSSQIIMFAVSIVMARLLTPTEYGIVGIVAVFTALFSSFIDAGLGQALIRKKDANLIDFHTVNVVNIGMSSLIYLILFFSAPYIAEFYEMPILTPTMRVLSLNLIIGALSGVCSAKLNKELKFKKIAMITLLTNIASAVIGIYLAYNGYGVWALVFQQVGATIFRTIWLLIVSRFFPKFRFSRTSFKELFGFGSKLLISNLLYSFFYNFYNLIIGKFFNAATLGYYNRASGYAGLISSNVNGVFQRVLYPVISKIQDDTDRLKRAYYKSISVSSFYIFPGTLFLAGIAHPLILVMISDKWLPCVPLLQILCFASLTYHLNEINMKFFLAKGFAGVVLKMTLWNRPSAIILFLIGILFGIEGVAYALIASNLFSTIIIFYYLNKNISDLPIFKSIKALFRIFIFSAVPSLISIYLFNGIIQPSWFAMIISLIIMTLLFLIMVKLFLPHILHEALTFHKK